MITISKGVLWLWVVLLLVMGLMVGTPIGYVLGRRVEPPTAAEKMAACIRQCATWSCRSDSAPACEACVGTCKGD